MQRSVDNLDRDAAFAFDNPSRQSMVPRIIPLAFLPSAIGLQSAAFNGASVIGPVIAGLLYIPADDQNARSALRSIQPLVRRGIHVVTLSLPGSGSSGDW